MGILKVSQRPEGISEKINNIFNMKFTESTVLLALFDQTTAYHQKSRNSRAVRNNIYGVPLAKCDRSIANDPNWPRTGYMRENYCTASSIDRGSHYVCVNLPEGQTASGQRYSPFWTITPRPLVHLRVGLRLHARTT